MKPRLLIVDDDRALTQQLYWTLSDDYEVLTANDLKSAFRRARVYEPEIAIVDLHMDPEGQPGGSGTRIIEFIRGLFPASAIIAISADATPAAKECCLRAGAACFIEKPIEVDRFLWIIGSIGKQRSMAPGRSLIC